MIQYTIGKYRLEVFNDQTFKEGSADNVHQYDFVYFEKSKYAFPTVFGLKVYEDERLIKSAVIGSVGGGTTIHKNSIIIEDNRFLVCCSNTIFCLSIPELILLWRTIADEATCLEIFKYQDSYIIHGELLITRLDKDGKILWQQSGEDIFTTAEGTNDFEITDDFILATDWGNKKYKFNFNGKSIK